MRNRFWSTTSILGLLALGLVLVPQAGLAVAPSPAPDCVPTTSTFSNTTPLAVPTGPAVVTSTITVAGASVYLSDLDAQTFLRHTFAGDIDMTLASPAGTIVTLTTDNGSGNDDVFNGTLWDDSANPGGQVPYTANTGLVTDGTYANLVVQPRLVPEEAMGAFVGENPNGTWTLTISDDAGGDAGTLDSWSLVVTTLPSAPVLTAATGSNTTPVAIPTGPAVVSSTITIAGAGTSLSDVDAQTSIQHISNTDLDVTLASPAGTVVTLTTDNGSTSDNGFDGTLWDDDANAGGQVPYTANNGLSSDSTYVNLVPQPRLVPEEAMGAFIGENPNGTWTLTISDDLTSNGGTLKLWSLDLDTAVCVNAPPVADPQSVTTEEGTSVAITLTGSDPDGDTLSFAVTSGPSNGTLSGMAPALSYAPNAGYNGPDSFTFEVTDGNGGSSTATVSITVTPVNNPPIADPQSVTTDEDTAVAITLTGSDPEGDTLSFAVTSIPAEGILSGMAPSLSYAPDANFNGSDSFTFEVTDGNGGSSTATVSITVTPVNDAPVADPQAVATDEDTAVAITLTGSDVEGDPLVFTVVSGPANGTLSGMGPDLSYTPSPDYFGPDSFTFQVDDGNGGTATAVVTILVNSVPLIDTNLVANPTVASVLPDATLFLTDLQATLTRDDDGSPLSGKEIIFSIAGTEVCRAVTDASGFAACGGMDAILNATLAFGYDASFLEDADHAASSAQGGVLLVDGTRIL